MLPTQFTAQLDAGWSVGGVIVNGKGQPIEGAEVRPSVEYKKRPGDLSQFAIGRRVKTDAEGRWRFNHVPASKSDVWVEIDHPEFKPKRLSLVRSEFEVSLEQKPSKPIELTPGLTVMGRVADSEGEPIAGALLRRKFFNDIRKATTNANVEYRINGCEPGMAKVVVSTDGKAVDMQEVRIGSDMEPVNFQMKPGGT
ncbi:carboxypeptidase-like regulatory domain-containing protein [Thalassoroseus pseudoceratinae]|uniref:carboxypeptidase-like regulatory domain-containing protein n=1 Tax=Thalassoroseus pseudoceratinae TaxID=2713176 RepID=UPI00197F6100|nr:carboxypeptidase-like regulatory domain-containing protein [Thalassoroseus pseudoceratinae]